MNGDGVITCEEFTKVFINMGFEEREKELKASIERQKRYERLRQEELDLKAQELAQKNSMKVSYEYSEAEYASAMEKLMDAAWRYDKTMPGAPALDAFEAKTMEPHVFKEQLRRAFYMKVTPQELGAIMHYFDKVCRVKKIQLVLCALVYVKKANFLSFRCICICSSVYSNYLYV